MSRYRGRWKGNGTYDNMGQGEQNVSVYSRSENTQKVVLTYSWLKRIEYLEHIKTLLQGSYVVLIESCSFLLRFTIPLL